MTRAPDSETRAPALSGGGTGARFGRGRHRRGRDAGPRRQTPRRVATRKENRPGTATRAGSPVSDRTLGTNRGRPRFIAFKAVYKHAINYSRGGAPVPPAGLAGTISGGISRMASLDERLMRRPAGPACVTISADPRAARQVAAHQDHRRDADRSARCDRECGARKASDQRLEREMSSDPYARLHDG